MPKFKTPESRQKFILNKKRQGMLQRALHNNYGMFMNCRQKKDDPTTYILWGTTNPQSVIPEEVHDYVKSLEIMKGCNIEIEKINKMKMGQFVPELISTKRLI